MQYRDFVFRALSVLFLSLSACGNDANDDRNDGGDIETDNPADVIVFPDPILDQAVRQAAGKPTGDILRSDVLQITSLIIIDQETEGFDLPADYTGMENLINLEQLHLPCHWCDTTIKDLSFLTPLTKITDLDLHGHSFTDISPLAGMTRMRQLNMSSNLMLNDISAVAFMPELEHLDLWIDTIEDISALSGLTKLTYLDLDSAGFTDATPLSKLVNLEYLDISWAEIKTKNELAGLTKLKFLDIGSIRFEDDTLDALSGMVDLESLVSIQNGTVDVGALRNLTHLQRLNLWNNSIVDISALEGLTELEDVDLAWNKIADIAPLVNNPGLNDGDDVDLGGNDMTCNETDIAGLQTLLNRGVEVHHDCVLPQS